MEGKVQFLDPEVAIAKDSFLQNRLEQISKFPFVKNIWLFADVNFKPRMEAPSSCAIASKELVLSFTSTAPNCGMGLIQTPLQKEDLTPERLLTFFKGFERSKKDKLKIKFKLDVQDYHDYDLNAQEFDQVLHKGPEAVLEKYGFDKSIIKNFEHLTPDHVFHHNLKEILPPDCYSQMPYGFGAGIAGNHFIEIQYVDEIIDKKRAKELGIIKGQVCVMYHNGPGVVSSILAKYYSNRKRVTKLQRLQVLLRKYRFHKSQAKSKEEFQERKRLFFSDELFTPVPPDSAWGKLIADLMKAQMNYGYAFRVATIKKVQERLSKAVGKPIKVNVLTDVSHNNITKEKVDGEDYYVHRHNACKVEPGKPVILPGFNNTCSYFGEGMSGSRKYLSTMDHGAGSVIKEWVKQGKLTKEDRYTLKFKPEDIENPEKVQHYSDEAVDHVVEVLNAKNIFNPIVKLRPLAVLKGKK